MKIECWICNEYRPKEADEFYDLCELKKKIICKYEKPVPKWCPRLKEEKMKETLGEFLTRLNSHPHLHPPQKNFILKINALNIKDLKEQLEYQYKCRKASDTAIDEIEEFLKDNDTIEIPRDIYDDLLNGELYYPSSVCKLRDWAEENKS